MPEMDKRFWKLHSPSARPPCLFQIHIVFLEVLALSRSTIRRSQWVTGAMVPFLGEFMYLLP